MAVKGSTKFPKPSVSVGEVTKAELNSAVDKLDTAISKLPTTATTDAIKTDVTKLKSDLTALDTSKANAADVAKLDTATKDLDTALKKLAALPADVSQSELDAAVADYNAKLKTANDAIAALQADETAYRTVGWGETLDFTAIKSNGAFSWAGATLVGGPLNSGSEGIGSGAYKGDNKNGTLSIVVLAAPDNRQIEGSWIATRTNGTLGQWTVASKASDFIVTTGNMTVVTGQNVAIAVGHLVTLSYVDVSKTIKLKPAGSATWSQITQYVSAGGFTVPNKPANGSAIVELKYNPGKSIWEAVVTADPLDTRLVAVEAKATANEGAIGGLDTRLKKLELVDYNLENYALDNGKLYTVVETIGLNSLVHLRADGKAELASDKDINKPADGIVLSVTAANGSVKIYGSGARISDLGQAGSLTGARFYTGTAGAINTSATGTGRLIQEIAVFNGSTYLMDFRDRGYWVA